MPKPSLTQLEQDVAYLAKRAVRAGSFKYSKYRDWGLSSNSIVGIAYGVGMQVMPWDRSDYAACVRAVRGLPRHRRTAPVMAALWRAKRALQEHEKMWGLVDA